MLTRIAKRCFSTSGSLLTWGQTTYGWGRPINNDFYTPGFVQGFNDVTNIASGPYHLAFTTANNNVYTVGHGKNGRLGHGSEVDAETPIRVELNANICQLACGQRHTLALTDNGEVYAWGYGGRSPLLGCSWLGVQNPLGTGLNSSSSNPVKIEIKNVSQISAGKDFSLAISNGRVYGWGQVNRLYEQPCSYPTELHNVNHYLESKHTQVKKISSTQQCAMFLLENGRLYALGKNIGGVTATRHNAKIITDNVLRQLTKINDHPLHGQKIEDFEISANSLIFRTDSGAIYYSGMHSKFLPTPFPSQVKAKSIWATRNSVGIIGQDNKIYFINDPIIGDHDKQGEVFVSDDANLHGVYKIGGSHLLRYALRRQQQVTLNNI